jgi:hypothetical protein
MKEEEGWQSSRIQLSNTYKMGFPPGAPVQCLDWHVKAADIVHLHHAGVYNKIAPDIAKRFPRVKLACTIHGSPDRERPIKLDPTPDYLTVVTADLLEQYPDAKLIPNFILDDDIQYTGALNKSTKIMLFQPVAHHLKDADQCQALAGAMSNFVTKVSMPGKHANVANKDQLAQMDKADFVWDHLQGYHGIISVEAMAHGAIPILGITPKVEHILKQVLGVSEIPWANSTQIARSWIANGFKDREWLSEKKAECRKFWEDHWRQSNIMPIYAEMYSQVL